jgi:hypothetical protein
MEWISFIKYLSLGYLVYYSINLFLDLLKPSSDKNSFDDREILEFSESLETQIVEPSEDSYPQTVDQSRTQIQKMEEVESIVQNEVEEERFELVAENYNVSTGGVSSMQELFKLAQNQSIEVKKQLVF